MQKRTEPQSNLTYENPTIPNPWGDQFKRG